MDLLVFFIFAGCVTMSSAVTCYTCEESSVPFDQEKGVFDVTDCSAPSQNNVDTDTTCTGTCLTTISLTTSYYGVTRSCLERSSSPVTPQCDTGCINLFVGRLDCRQCCDSDFCNNAAVDDVIKENRMGQTCYECRHSEIPYIGNFNPSCGMAFDPEGTDLRYSFCQGLCYTAVTFIEGVEDVRRGCQTFGISCDNANNPYLEDKAVSINGLEYDMKCCLGSLCNGDRSDGSAIGMSVLAFFLAELAQFLALAL